MNVLTGPVHEVVPPKVLRLRKLLPSHFGVKRTAQTVLLLLREE